MANAFPEGMAREISVLRVPAGNANAAFRWPDLPVGLALIRRSKFPAARLLKPLSRWVRRRRLTIQRFNAWQGTDTPFAFVGTVEPSMRRALARNVLRA
jgi:hypothetical protein